MKKLGSIFFNSFIEILFIVLLIITKCYINDLGSFVNIIKISAYLISVIIIFYYILNAKYTKPCILCCCYVMLTISISYMEIYSNGMDAFLSYLPILALYMYIELGIDYDSEKIVKNLYYSLLILVSINFISIILYPQGLYIDNDFNYTNNWFFRYDNTHMFYYMPTLALALIVNKKDTKILNIFTYLIIGYSVFYCFSANSVVCFVLFVVLYILSKNKNKIFKITKFIKIYVIAFFGLVIFRIQNLFSWLIVDILKKDLTFTNRTIIWDKIMEYIKYKPFFGYGTESPTIISQKLGSIHWTHAHNTFLDIMYKSGIIGLCIFISLLVCSFNRIKKIRNRKNYNIISITMFCSLIMMIFEARQNHIGLFIILALANNLYKIDKDEVSNEE